MGSFWAVKPEWKGRTVAIVGGGPSLSLRQIRHLGIAHAKGLIKTISVNDAVYPAWFADIEYSCDRKWWQHHGDLPGFAGIKVSCEDSGVPDVRWLKKTGNTGYDPIPGHLRTGGNSGYQAVHLAAQLGVKKIVLVAFDMTSAPQQHWFGVHPQPLACRAMSQEPRIRAFVELNVAFEELGIEVINTSSQTALTFFKAASLEAAIPIGGQ